ncbi:8-oxoguanine glycosylase ogg1 [Gonapodya sp. JEL0774]|nr:8-oxoguanine glycosylase ogg1 [Gonapodya sp. JEL0774]
MVFGRYQLPPVNALCREYGSLVGLPSHLALNQPPFHEFPTISQLASALDLEPRLRDLGFGYRAKYVAETCAKLASHKDPESYLLSLRTSSYSDTIAALLEFPGVGPKVADCVALMSLDKAEAVPVDRHVWQIALRDYNFTLAEEIDEITGEGSSAGDENGYSPGKRKRKGTTKVVNSPGKTPKTLTSKVLFTADLKAFSNRIEDDGDVENRSPSSKKTKRTNMEKLSTEKLASSSNCE